MVVSMKNLRDRNVLSIDFVMLVLIIFNLLWLSFDWLFASKGIQRLIVDVWPQFHEWYLINIHENFFQIDMLFVIVFLMEFMVRWVLAIVRREYYRWYFYPLAHWYDVLGLVPVGFLRILRLLRIFSIMYRLQRMGIIDLRRTYVYKKLDELRNIVAEEITDRVLINILTGIQQGVRKQNDGSEENVLVKVITPERERIINWLSNKVKTAAEENYVPQKEKLRKMIQDNVHDVMENNESVDKLEAIPIVGKGIAKQLELAIAETLFNTLDSVVYTFALDPDNRAVEELAEMGLDSLESQDSDPELNDIIQTVVVGVLDEMKAKIAVKEWHDRTRQEQLIMGTD